ncbi:MAG: ribonuclease HII [Proteobacteria bacterium]|nr:ribonuclease HII [Pseudomonadota bacterium]
MALKKTKGRLFPDLKEEAALGFFVSGTLIIGVDEVGRGCLAGPVVAGAAVLDPREVSRIGFSGEGERPASGVGLDPHPLFRVQDSKLIPEKLRPGLASALEAAGISGAVAEASVEEISELNILYASQLAMERAVHALEKKIDRKADLVLIDGNQVPKGLKDRGRAIVKGDLKSLTIACASIYAKVHRDALMDRLESEYPGYGLMKHKGYPTPFHKERIRELGATGIHRSGFKGVE